MGFAGAGHAFTKIGIDDGEQGALAGPELLVKHADQDDWGDPHRRNGQAAGGRPRGAAQGKSKVLIDGTDKLMQACCDSCRRWTCSWAGVDELSPSGALGGKGGEKNETCHAALQGRVPHSQFDSRWLECWGALGFGGFGLHPNTAQSHQI